MFFCFQLNKPINATLQAFFSSFFKTYSDHTFLDLHLAKNTPLEVLQSNNLPIHFN